MMRIKVRSDRGYHAFIIFSFFILAGMGGPKCNTKPAERIVSNKASVVWKFVWNRGTWRSLAGGRQALVQDTQDAIIKPLASKVSVGPTVASRLATKGISKVEPMDSEKVEFARKQLRQFLIKYRDIDEFVKQVNDSGVAVQVRKAGSLSDGTNAIEIITGSAIGTSIIVSFEKLRQSLGLGEDQ